jgi:hypothetical protein
MDEDAKVVTASAETPDITDRYETESNVVPEAEPKEVEPQKDKTTEAETPATEPAVEPTEPKPINPRTAQRKAEKERLLTENATMREQLRQLQEHRAPKAEEPKARDLSKEPDINDYDDAVEYTRDVARYDRRQEALQESLQKQTEALAERADAVRAEKPDFDEKVGALVSSQLITPDIEKAILASPVGADVSYHLANYGSDLMTLRGLPPAALPQAIKAIEAFIKNGGEQEKPKVTRAAPPITPPGVSSTSDSSISSYTTEQYETAPLSELRAKKLI